MAVTQARQAQAERRTRPSKGDVRALKPKLLFFHSQLDGRSRRVSGFLAQILQRRRNHATFTLYRIAQEDRPDLLDRFAVERVPTLCVVEGKRLQGRLVAPRGCREIEQFLAPWLK